MTHCAVCGHEVGTPYCPMCGAKMPPTSVLHEIREHCSRYLKCKERTIKYYQERHSDKPQWLREEECKAAKWKRWVEALNKAIERECEILDPATGDKT